MVPGSIGQFISSDIPYKFDILKAVLGDLFYRENYPYTDETADSFLSKRFGRELTDKFFSAFVRTTTGSGLNISMKSSFPAIWEGSCRGMRSMLLPIFRGDYPPTKFNELVDELMHKKDDKEFVEKMKRLRAVYRFSHSIHLLTDALGNYLNRADNVEIYKNSPVIAMTPEKDGEGLVNVSFKNALSHTSHEIKARTVVAACPALDLAKILLATFGGKASSVIDALYEIKYNNLTTVNIAFQDIYLDFEGFGYAVPISEKTPVYGTMYLERSIKNKKTIILTSICGTDEIEKILGKNPTSDSIIRLILKEVTNHLGLDDSVRPFACNLRKFGDTFPRYQYGHYELVRWITKGLENLYDDSFKLLGTCYFGLGLATCVLNARNLSIDLYNRQKKQVLVNKFLKHAISTPMDYSKHSTSASKKKAASASSYAADSGDTSAKVSVNKKGTTKKRSSGISTKKFTFKPQVWKQDHYDTEDADISSSAERVLDEEDEYNSEVDSMAKTLRQLDMQDDNMLHYDDDEIDDEFDIDKKMRSVGGTVDKDLIEKSIQKGVANKRGSSD